MIKIDDIDSVFTADNQLAKLYSVYKSFVNPKRSASLIVELCSGFLSSHLKTLSIANYQGHSLMSGLDKKTC